VKLRQKFLGLVAGLLLFVLGGSFALIFSDLRAEFIRDFENDLETAASAFRSQEKQRFRTLDVMAGFLESSPSFRNVLRRSDYETLHEFLLDVNGSSEVGVIIVTDADGKLLNRTDRHGEQGTDMTQEIPIQVALQGEFVKDYWLNRGALYQVVSVPLVDAQDYVDGTLTLGFGIDQPFINDQKTELGGDIAFQALPNWSLSTSQDLLKEPQSRFLSKRLPLGPSPTQPSATFILGKDLKPMRSFVKNSQFKLLKLAGAAMMIALLVSVPLIGKMTNPVELLEQAQAEMETIFTANLDGLVAADEHGIITSCNPAATIALGLEAEELRGQPLMEKLPEAVHEQLQSATGDSEVATFTRQGRDFKLYRTFVRMDSSDLLGSIVLFHDITQDNERERLFRQFLGELKDDIAQPGAPASLVMGLKNLQAWSRLKEGLAQPEPKPCSLKEVESALLEGSCGTAELAVEFADGEVWADQHQLILILQNLISYAQGQGSKVTRVSARRDGGAFRFQVDGRAHEASCREILDPLRADLGPHGLGLFVSAELLKEQSRLRVDNQKGQLSFLLPVAVETEC
jgi:PAS domain S-box-containing protein